MKDNSIDNQKFGKALTKVNYIISQNEEEEEEAKYDSIIKHLTNIIFKNDINNKFIFPIIKYGKSELLIKFVDLIYEIFGKSKKTREEPYNMNQKNITDNEISKIIVEIDSYKDIDSILEKDKIKDLYISMKISFLIKKKS